MKKIKQIGYFGLGKMGKGMVERLLEKGYQVVASNRSPEPIKEMEKAGAKGAYSLSELAASLPAPRTIWLMVSHNAVDAVLQALAPLLSKGDTIIDGGNCFYEDTLRRSKELAERGIDFLDAGVSGGPGGARKGAAIMVGGKQEVYAKYEELFADLSAPGAYHLVGSHGAGHFVKMVHNGIEYGMMQSIAEGFNLLKSGPYKLDLLEVSRIYNNGSVVESRLMGWLESAFLKFGQDLKLLSGSVGFTGEGEWTAKTAKELKVPAEIIEKSFEFRVKSQDNPSFIGKILTGIRNQFGGHTIERGKMT